MCVTLGTGLQGSPRGLPVEDPSGDGLVVAMRPSWRLLRGACSLEALAGDVAPGRPENRKHTRGGPSFSSAH